MEKHICDCEMIHEAVVADTREKLQPETEYTSLAALFKMFGDGTRVKLLHALEQNELCVCDLAALLGVTKSAVSHQLRILRDAHLVNSRKEGRMVFYSLCDEHVKTIIETALEHVAEDLR